jgi:hypothetical protein
VSLTVTAKLGQDDVAALLDELLPLKVDLTAEEDEEPGDRWLRIEKAHHVDFVVSEGLRVHTTALVQWRAAGMRLRGNLQSVELLVRPLVESDERGGKLVFRPAVEKLDLKHIPAFVDRRIAGRINQALAAQGDRLGWHFGESLALDLPMPHNLAPVEALALGAGAGTVEVFDDCLVFTLRIETHFKRAAPAVGESSEQLPPVPAATGGGEGVDGG